MTCPGCGRRLRFRPQLQGKTVKCPCGRAFLARPDSEITGPGGRVPRRAQIQSEELSRGRFRDLVVPTIFILLGLIARAAIAPKTASELDVFVAIPAAFTLIEWTLSAVAVAATVFAGARFLDLEIEQLLPAALKSLAIAGVGMPFVFLICSFDTGMNNVNGLIVGIHAIFLLDLGLLCWLFRARPLDGLALAIVLLILRSFVALMLVFGSGSPVARFILTAA